jgi:hypothetical protein
MAAFESPDDKEQPVVAQRVVPEKAGRAQRFVSRGMAVPQAAKEPGKEDKPKGHHEKEHCEERQNESRVDGASHKRLADYPNHSGCLARLLSEPWPAISQRRPYDRGSRIEQ